MPAAVITAGRLSHELDAALAVSSKASTDSANSAFVEINVHRGRFVARARRPRPLYASGDSTGTVGPAYTAHCRRSLLSTSLPTLGAYRSEVSESNGEHITRRSSGIGIRHLRLFMDEQVD